MINLLKKKTSQSSPPMESPKRKKPVSSSKEPKSNSLSSLIKKKKAVPEKTPLFVPSIQTEKKNESKKRKSSTFHLPNMTQETKSFEEPKLVSTESKKEPKEIQSFKNENQSLLTQIPSGPDLPKDKLSSPSTETKESLISDQVEKEETKTNHQLVPSYAFIDDSKQKSKLYEIVKTKFDIKLYNNNMYYPGPNPVALRKDHIQTILKNEYMITSKSDGVRFMLILTRNDKGEAVAVMMDRKIQFYAIKVCAKDAYFDGTIADGELVWDSKGKKMTYLIFDIISVAGDANIKNQNLKQRLEKIHSLFFDEGNGSLLNPLEEEQRIQNLAKQGKIISQRNHYSLSFKPKLFYSIDQFDLLKDIMDKKSDHQNDGIIIMPVNQPVLINTASTIFKYKTHHTIDLVLAITENSVSDSKNQWLFGLYYVDDRNHFKKSVSQVAFSDACKQFPYDENTIYKFQLCPNQTLSTFIKTMKQKGIKKWSGIAEFEIELKNLTVCCSLKNFRFDKSNPNNWYVCQQTILNKKENITFEELKHLLAPAYIQSMTRKQYSDFMSVPLIN